MRHFVNSIDKPWRQACQPFHRPDSYTTFPVLFPSLLLMFAQSGICRDKVLQLYLSWRFPGDWYRQHSSEAERSIMPNQIGMCNSDGLFDSLIYGACCSCQVWNVIGINSGTGWYRNHFNPNSSHKEVWGGDWWCMLGVSGLSLSCLIQHFENILPPW